LSDFNAEVEAGERFQFGENWGRFLSTLNDERINEAELSLKTMLNVDNLSGKKFLDIGSGSGLFSLAARRLGATVHSLDYDPQSVACTRTLKDQYFTDDNGWVIEQGSALDSEHIKQLGEFDIVYSWGVLHHTGDMWNALENATYPVVENGRLFVSIYNDQGWVSRWWKRVKKLYCSNKAGRYLVTGFYFTYWFIGGLVYDILKLNNPMKRYTDYYKERGMSRTHDWIDWLGGNPFEVAKPEEIFDFFKQRGFVLEKMKTCAGGLGCNEFIFDRKPK
jgi:2-polyprenyl-6-hydroxyphenyl methylase/3-demethylubiquinone-9 3-methyltransferase